MPVPIVIDNSGANTTAGRVTRQNFPLASDVVLVTTANKANITGGVLPMTIDEYAKLNASFYFDFLQSANPIYPTGLTTTTTIDADRTFINSSGLITQGTSNVWATDYDPVTLLPKGRQVEETRANLVPRYDNFGAGWAAVGTPTRSAAAATQGIVNLDLIGDDDATALEGYTQTITYTGNATKSVSLLVKQGTSTSMVVRLRDTTAPADRLLVAITWTGGIPTVTATTGSQEVAPENYGNGIWRIKLVTSAVTAANTNSLQIYPATDAALSVANTGNIYVGGVQSEDGTFATSIIPTAAAAVTRSADACSIALPSGFNATEGTFVLEGIWGAPSTYGTSQVAASIDDGSTTEWMVGYRVASTGQAGFFVNDGGAAQVNMTAIGALTTSSVSRLAFAYKANDFGASANGGAVTTDTSGTIPTVTTLRLGSQPGGTPANLNGWLRKLYYFNTRFDDRNIERAST